VNIFFEKAKASEISCESYANVENESPVGMVKTCLMNETTVINEENVSVSNRDENTLGFTFEENKNIFVLPIGAAEAFPNLLVYNAYKCKISEVSKKHFAGLKKLQTMLLSNNQIENIPSDLFEDLTSLVIIHLCKNN
jgi:Leucine-rich repeat (LRR) protein